MNPIKSPHELLIEQGSATVKAEQIFPWVHEYSTNPDDDATPSDALFTYVTQAKGFKVERFQHG